MLQTTPDMLRSFTVPLVLTPTEPGPLDSCWTNGEIGDMIANRPTLGVNVDASAESFLFLDVLPKMRSQSQAQRPKNSRVLQMRCPVHSLKKKKKAHTLASAVACSFICVLQVKNIGIMVTSLEALER